MNNSTGHLPTGASNRKRNVERAVDRLFCCVIIFALCLAAERSAFADDPVPVLTIGVMTNLNLAAGEVAEFSLPVTVGTTYTLDLAAAGHAVVLVKDAGDQPVGRFLAAYGLSFTADEESVYTLTVSGNGVDPLDARLAAYAGALPFYRPAAEEELPEFMTNPWFEGAEFGYVYVPADRSSENRHSYRLAILQMPGGPEATSGPLVYLSGGPGVSAFGGAFLKAPFTNICPVIVVNQRGAWLSQPDLFPVSTEETTLELQQRLGGPGGIDFNTINTRDNAADILDVMTALGHHESFNLWGTSYGTMLTQEVIRQAPDRIRAAVLDGVVTMDQPQWTTISQTFLDALNALFDDVAQHPEASLLYPDFGTQFFDFASGLYPDEHGDFFDLVFHAMNLSRWGHIEKLPGIIWRAVRGETAALEELAAIRLPDVLPPDGGPISANMYCAILRQDFLPFESMDTADALTNSIPFPLNMHGHDYSRFQFEFSEEWDFLDPAPESFRQPVTNDVPVLVLNGTYDTQTGLTGASHVADHLPNAYYVEIPATGHAVLFGGEVVYQIARDFLTNPIQAPDTSGLLSLSLDFSPPWPADAPPLGAEESVMVEIEADGQAVWHRFTVERGVVYDIQHDGATLHIVDNQARVLFSSQGPAQWKAGDDGEVHLMLVADTGGIYPLRLDRPLLIHAIEMDQDQVVLTWQGPTGTTNTIEVATDLVGPTPFNPLVQDLPALESLRSHPVPLDPGAGRLFFRITEP